MATPPSTPLSPREWCYGLLRALREQTAAGTDIRYLERLLTHFYDRNPPAAEFGELLVDYLITAPPGDRDTAERLQRSWLRSQLGGQTPTQSLQETLRTLGALLDAANVSTTDVATVEVAPGQVAIGAFGKLRRRELGPLRLRQQSAARMALRGTAPAADPTTLDRYEPRLRAVGAALDRQPAQSYRVVAAPHLIVVEGTAGYVGRFTTADLTALLQQTITGRQDA